MTGGVADNVANDLGRVLVIDDTPDDRVLVRREAEALFPSAGIVEAGTREAFEAALAGPPFGLVVTDLALKWGDGREVLARAHAAGPGCPIVMFTASGDETTAVELMKAGLDDYVVKSVRQLPRLRVSLRNAVEAARNRSALTLRERQLTAALAHQRVITGELHHRVKNNLQTIDSLLRLQAKANGGAVAALLDELAGRMRTLAAVQSRLYDTEALDRVEFSAVLDDIATSLAAVYGVEARDLLRDLAGPLDLDVSRAMPLGLLVYEIILNALKHAWPGRRPGKLSVELRSQSGHAEIRVGDDGVGFAAGAVSRGLGSRLVQALAREARAAVTTQSRPGGGTLVELRLL